MNIITKYLEKYCNSLKLKSFSPYMLELTVLVNVKIDNLNEFSRFIPEIVNIEESNRKDNIKIKSVIKYLLISFVSILVPENSNLLTNTFIGLA